MQSASADALDNVSPNTLKTASPCMAVTSHFQAPTIGIVKYTSSKLRRIHFPPIAKRPGKKNSAMMTGKQFTGTSDSLLDYLS